MRLGVGNHVAPEAKTNWTRVRSASSREGRRQGVGALILRESGADRTGNTSWNRNCCGTEVSEEVKRC